MKNIILKKCAAAALAGGTLLALTACAALPVLTPAPTATVPASVAAAPTETPTASPVSADIASVLPEPTPEVEVGQEELIALLDDIEANQAYAGSGLSVYSVSLTICSQELKKYKTHVEIIEALSSLDYIYHIEEMH